MLFLLGPLGSWLCGPPRCVRSVNMFVFLKALLALMMSPLIVAHTHTHFLVSEERAGGNIGYKRWLFDRFWVVYLHSRDESEATKTLCQRTISDMTSNGALHLLKGTKNSRPCFWNPLNIPGNVSLWLNIKSFNRKLVLLLKSNLFCLVVKASFTDCDLLVTADWVRQQQKHEECWLEIKDHEDTQLLDKQPSQEAFFKVQCERFRTIYWYWLVCFH